MLQWGDVVGAGLVSLIFLLAPFVSTALLGVVLLACAVFWLLLTLSDEVDETTDPAASDREVATSKGITFTTPIHLLVTLYWAISGLATVLSPVRRAALEGFTKLTLYMILFALMARVLRSPRVRSWVVTLFLNVALFVSIYGCQQKFIGVKPLATWSDPDSALGNVTRVYSYLGNPNLLAAYLVPAILFSFVAIFAWRRLLPKLLAVTMVVVNILCLVWTYSRGGWIGLVCGLFMLSLLLVYWWSIVLPPFWQRWALPIVVGSIAGVLILAVLFVAPLRDRASSMLVGREDKSNNFRLNVWLSVLQMIKARPILGIGPGNDAFNAIYPFYQKTRFTALSAYSIPLEIAVETGIIGLTCFIWFLTVTVSVGWTQLKRLQQLRSREGFWLMAAIASLAGMLGHGFVDTVWYRPQINTLWWLMIAIIASYYTQLRESEVQDV